MLAPGADHSGAETSDGAYAAGGAGRVREVFFGASGDLRAIGKQTGQQQPADQQKRMADADAERDSVTVGEPGGGHGNQPDEVAARRRFRGNPPLHRDGQDTGVHPACHDTGQHRAQRLGFGK